MGLVTKARIAEEYGFRMVADGHQGFEAKKFRLAMEEMILSGSAHGYIVILDTLKKFVNINLNNAMEYQFFLPSD